jgi:hypothetical protein
MASCTQLMTVDAWTAICVRLSTADAWSMAFVCRRLRRAFLRAHKPQYEDAIRRLEYAAEHITGVELARLRHRTYLQPLFCGLPRTKLSFRYGFYTAQLYIMNRDWWRKMTGVTLSMIETGCVGFCGPIAITLPDISPHQRALLTAMYALHTTPCPNPYLSIMQNYMFHLLRDFNTILLSNFSQRHYIRYGRASGYITDIEVLEHLDPNKTVVQCIHASGLYPAHKHSVPLEVRSRIKRFRAAMK